MTQAFTLDTPHETHFRPATCEEVECRHHIFGWTTVLDPEQHADLISAVLNSGRHYTQMRSEEASELSSKPLPPGLMAFVFPAGQQCFNQHRVQLDKLPLMAHRRGGNRRQHTRVENFVEHYNEQAYAVNRLRQKG